jgi:nicotinate-nucleotide adenylyltransferase
MSAAEAGWKGIRIGVLGGTFDPPHTGHLRMARAARDTLSLDRVFFSVAPHPPHKPGQALSRFEHRRAMVAAAIADEDRFALTDIEASHDPSWTVDLLRACRQRTSAALYFIMGADSLAELASWKDPEEILRLCTLAVFPRDDHAMRLPVPGEAGVVIFEAPRVDLSSSDIRAAIEAGTIPGGALPEAVARYVEREHLYRGS